MKRSGSSLVELLAAITISGMFFITGTASITMGLDAVRKTRQQTNYREFIYEARTLLRMATQGEARPDSLLVKNNTLTWGARSLICSDDAVLLRQGSSRTLGVEIPGEATCTLAALDASGVVVMTITWPSGKKDERHKLRVLAQAGGTP